MIGKFLDENGCICIPTSMRQSISYFCQLRKGKCDPVPLAGVGSSTELPSFNQKFGDCRDTICLDAMSYMIILSWMEQLTLKRAN